MNKHIYAAGSFTLALAMSVLPAAALAESESGTGLSATAQITTQVSGVTVTTGEDSEATREQAKQQSEVVREQQKQELEQEKSLLENESSSEDESLSEDQDDQDEIEIELEDDEDVASSLEDLKQKIEERKQELEDEEASTTPKFKDAMKNANEVRLAVHALLASKDLVGGIGSQVSEIAKRMNDSIATTTNAEARIQSRGFLSRLFFGGDSTAAEMIAREASQNQERVQALTSLLAEAGVSVEVRAELEARIAALEAAQARLKVLAEKEQKAWGLFSWRF